MFGETVYFLFLNHYNYILKLAAAAALGSRLVSRQPSIQYIPVYNIGSIYLRKI